MAANIQPGTVIGEDTVSAQIQPTASETGPEIKARSEMKRATILRWAAPTCNGVALGIMAEHKIWSVQFWIAIVITSIAVECSWNAGNAEKRDDA